MKAILEKLISFPSVTPFDNGCQDYMIDFFENLGFTCHKFNNPPVSNFVAHVGSSSPFLLFAGHTDVVSIGDETKWQSPPFNLTERDGMLFGRGCADMKGGLACMMAMASRFLQNNVTFTGSLGFLITSGEEGDDYNLGTKYVMEELYKQGIHPDYCIVGEPSSTQFVGDVIKIGRRGSLSGKLTLNGKQGHVAYPHLAENPIHTISPALCDLINIRWDVGNEHFPPTSFQITKIAAGVSGNIIPGELSMDFNFRFSTASSVKSLKQNLNACFKSHNLTPLINWQLSGEPFLTTKGKLLDTAINAIKLCSEITTQLSTSGGTSDGRFIAPYGIEVIELGLVNTSIHQVNECIAADSLEKLTAIYYSISEQILLGNSSGSK